VKFLGMGLGETVAAIFCAVVCVLAAPYYIVAPDWTRKALEGKEYGDAR